MGRGKALFIERCLACRGQADQDYAFEHPGIYTARGRRSYAPFPPSLRISEQFVGVHIADESSVWDSADIVQSLRIWAPYEARPVRESRYGITTPRRGITASFCRADGCTNNSAACCACGCADRPAYYCASSRS